MSTTMSTKILCKDAEATALKLRLDTGLRVRLAARSNEYTKSTSGLAPTYLQANLVVLPSRYAADFRGLCARNPVPCPLIAESSSVGNYSSLKSYLPRLSTSSQLAAGLDLRTDCPRYNVYDGSRLSKAGVSAVTDEWTDDHVAFLIGCSHCFESALECAGFTVRHSVQDRTVPIYRTSVPLNPSGIFTGSTYVVSMRPFPKKDIERVREITRAYAPTHGEPLAWGWDALARLGIADIDLPQWGDAPLTEDGQQPLGTLVGDDNNVPVFWGCGVTPQEAIMKAPLEGTILAHAPGHMLVLDCREDDVL
ncbi:hypothetical protein F503_01176 [Ophiostoma piceae UAMH 11346]|uniref:Duf1445 domain protein n=1 Tax=Ophiostoma piceae (strain UAMH 11346) TaxID=1262450 RepID=S3CPA9_OPHP1|nr:hypothetical protein F503_01176 [Ophiostoma piceae UAMH 11346]